MHFLNIFIIFWVMLSQVPSSRGPIMSAILFDQVALHMDTDTVYPWWWGSWCGLLPRFLYTTANMLLLVHEAFLSSIKGPNRMLEASRNINIAFKRDCNGIYKVLVYVVGCESCPQNVCLWNLSRKGEITHSSLCGIPLWTSVQD